MGLVIPLLQDKFAALDHLRQMLGVPFFIEIVVSVLWSIWEVRNDAIFRFQPPSIQSFKRIFKREFAWVILRAKANYQPLISQWLEVLV